MLRPLLPAVVFGCVLGACSQGSAPAAPDEDASLTRLERIGKAAFFDANLSEPQGTSCSSCHDPAQAFSGSNGGRDGAPLGADHRSSGFRNAPSAMYAAFAPAFAFVDDGEGPQPVGGQFLDGRVDSLEAQARRPLFEAAEMNNASDAALAAKVANAAYASLMAEEFGADVFASASRAVDALASAIAAFERTPRFAPFSSKYDAYIQGRATLSAQESQGLALFMDAEKANCVACHVADPKSAKPRDSQRSNAGGPCSMGSPSPWRSARSAGCLSTPHDRSWNANSLLHGSPTR